MTKKKNKGESFFRSIDLGVAERKIDEAKRTVSLPVASSEPVSRWFGKEVLRITEDAVDLTRLNNGAAVLDIHEGKQIGVVERAWIEAGRLWATLRFSKRAEADDVFKDIVDGIVRNVSIGYRTLKRQLVKEEADGAEAEYEVTRWMPFEVSMVPVPADPTVGVGRSLDDTSGEPGAEETAGGKPPQEESGNSTRGAAPPAAEPPKPQTQVTVETEEKRKMDEKEKEAAMKAERERTGEILALGRAFGMGEQADQAVKDGTELGAFRKLVLDKQAADAKANAKRGENIGLNTKEIRAYSFSRAILSLCGERVDKDAAGFEIECSRAYAAKIGKEPQGIFVPPDVTTRTFDLTTGGGTNLVGTQLRPDLFIDLLRNKIVCQALGARVMAGLVGNLAISRQTGAATGYWFNPESAGITAASNPTVDQVPLAPKTCGAYTDLSRRLLKQSTPDAEALVRDDLTNVLALLIDLAGLKGSGTPQPTGIANTSGIGAAYWGVDNTPTWAEIVAMETVADVANALAPAFAYVMGAGLRGGMKTIPKVANMPVYLMGDNGQVNGYPSAVTNQLAAGECIFGLFSDLIIGLWGGLDLQVNPYIEALAKAGSIRVTALQDCDVAVRRPQSFVYYSNNPAS